MTRAIAWTAAAVVVSSMALVAFGFARYAGNGSVFLILNLCFFALAALAFPQPRLYAYTFLTAFLLLGFWVKVVFHAIWAPEFVEPVGAFSNTPGEWDSALIVSTCGAVGVMAARLAQLWWARRQPDALVALEGPPQWFVRWEVPAWIISILMIIAVNTANFYFAFYQIGVRPKLLLPLSGHVVLAWLVNIGFALWVASLVWWHYQRRRILGRSLMVPIGESLLSATSAFSRIIFLVHALPYVLAILERREQLVSAIKRRSVYRLLIALSLLFVVSIVTVFWLRVYQYYGYAGGAGGAEPLAQHVARTIHKQVPLLLIHRWVGLEGVLAVGATERSTGRLADAVMDSPKSEGKSLFQRIAKPAYLSENPEQFVFLANAGPIAVLWFSGSLVVVFLGMVAIGLLLFATEEAARRWTGNPFLLAIAGAALANVVSQTTFFYLTLIFLLQLWLALAFLAALQRLKLWHT